MEISNLTRNIMILGVTAAVSSSVTYWYCSSQYEEERLAMKDKISTLEANERNAIVTRRISEQMEDIAYESKNIADSARSKAEFESHKAMEQAERAERERINALKAKDLADKAEVVAREQEAKAKLESQRAMEQAQRAEYERAKADTLRYIALGRFLAQASITQFNAGDSELAQLLAYSGYSFTMGYNGDPYQQDVFTSLLYNAHQARNVMAHYTGNVRAVQCIGQEGRNADQDDDIIVLTDYGEVARVSATYNENDGWTGYENNKFFTNENYLFRDICVIDSMVYALDANGIVVSFNIKKGKDQTPTAINVANSTRGNERWLRLLKKKNGNIIAVGEHQISWIDTKKNEVYQQRYIEELITEAGIGDGKLIIFSKQGKYYVFHEGEPVIWTMELPKNTYVTSYFYHKAKNLHAVGTDNGDIYFFTNDGVKVANFTGHTGPITHMDNFDWRFVTSSYDKTIRIWNIDQLGGLVLPLEVKCASWPLCFDIDEEAKAIRVGYANGDIESIRFSVHDNANSVYKNLKREFTQEEWKYYIGKDEPYRFLGVGQKH